MNYHALITDEFSELMGRHNDDISSIPAEQLPASQVLMKYIKEGNIKLEPLFPGIKDPLMKRFFTVQIAGELEAGDLEALQSDSLFEGFYRKPPEALPG